MIIVFMDGSFSMSVFPQAISFGLPYSHVIVLIYNGGCIPQTGGICSSFLRVIAQIRRTFSSTPDFFCTFLKVQVFSVWQIIPQKRHQPIPQSTQKLHPSFPDKHTVTEMRLPVPTTQTSRQKVKPKSTLRFNKHRQR